MEFHSKNIIDVFRPPNIKFAELDIPKLNSATGRVNFYASKGRNAIIHIIHSLQIKGPLLLPAYICDSVYHAINKLGIKVVFYDLDLEDLNPSLQSIKHLSEKYKCDSVVVASMYGNPANLASIEDYCMKAKVFLIDDAAQSFGAKLNGRLVGSFGDAGFFSFSPGKATAGHMGAFFWSSKDLKIKRTQHSLYHRLSYYSFLVNRLHRGLLYRLKMGALLERIVSAYDRVIDITNDDIAKFEKKILGGLISSQLSGIHAYRDNYAKQFSTRFSSNSAFKVIQCIRGDSSAHKLIALCYSQSIAEELIDFLRRNGIYSSNGYRPLTADFEYLPNNKKIKGCVVEIPIENCELKMCYLFKRLEDFIRLQ